MNRCAVKQLFKCRVSVPTYMYFMQRLDDLDVLKVLGAGTYGTVLLCEKKSDGSVYAVKMIEKMDILRRVSCYCTLMPVKCGQGEATYVIITFHRNLRLTLLV